MDEKTLRIIVLEVKSPCHVLPTDLGSSQIEADFEIWPSVVVKKLILYTPVIYPVANKQTTSDPILQMSSQPLQVLPHDISASLKLRGAPTISRDRLVRSTYIRPAPRLLRLPESLRSPHNGEGDLPPGAAVGTRGESGSPPTPLVTSALSSYSQSGQGGTYEMTPASRFGKESKEPVKSDDLDADKQSTSEIHLPENLVTHTNFTFTWDPKDEVFRLTGVPSGTSPSSLSEGRRTSAFDGNSYRNAHAQAPHKHNGNTEGKKSMHQFYMSLYLSHYTHTHKTRDDRIKFRG
ncbi:hypothetical protein M231_06755 [Tremella mesenterica]|uniref:Uncharacterized protein n=1 Tax=Tremella mesenterica TaxID=5217 RepID=A0A4Q1BDF2_TREME|nr:hypothetical protein M231_06755 [Tremella mesenterica]